MVRPPWAERMLRSSVPITPKMKMKSSTGYRMTTRSPARPQRGAMTTPSPSVEPSAHVLAPTGVDRRTPQDVGETVVPLPRDVIHSDQSERAIQHAWFPSYTEALVPSVTCRSRGRELVAVGRVVQTKGLVALARPEVEGHCRLRRCADPRRCSPCEEDRRESEDRPGSVPDHGKSLQSAEAPPPPAVVPSHRMTSTGRSGSAAMNWRP